MQTGIYTITSPSGRCYVGSAVNFARRWAVHRYWLRRGRHHCAGLQSAFNKYGEFGLRFERLLICTPSDLIFYEQRALDAFGRARLYNGNTVAGSQLGFKHSVATRESYSRVRKGKPIAGWTPERRERQLAALARRGPVSEATRAKMSATRKGRPMAEHVGPERAQRLANRKYVQGSSKYPGVSRYRDKWQARLRVNGLRLHIGYFTTPEAAYEAIRTKAKDLQVELPVIESVEQ